MKVLVTGSRDMHDRDYGLMLRELEALKPTVVVHGGARGADTLAAAVAEELQVNERIYPAQWRRYGRAAGPMRNQQMLDEERPDMVLAFPGPRSRGTWDMVKRARKVGVKVKVVKLTEEDRS